jgi:hypothetical protein
MRSGEDRRRVLPDAAAPQAAAFAGQSRTALEPDSVDAGFRRIDFRR